MRTRILTAVLLMPIVAAVYFGPAWLFWLMAAGATLGMTREALQLFGHAGARPLEAPVFVSVVLVMASFAAPQKLPLGGALAAGAACCFGGWMLLRRTTDGALAGLGAMLAAVVYPGVLMGFQVALRGLQAGDGAGERHAPALLVFLYAAVFGGDAAAYFVGRAVGRTPLAPLVSPKKTVEGFIAAVLGGAALGAAFAAWLPTGLPLGKAAFLGGLLATAGAFGDLTKSLLKRSADVKDSGTLLPGHGGLLDRLDGLLISSPLLYLVLTSPILTGDP